MLRGKIFARAFYLCLASWLVVACDADPSFDVQEGDSQSGIDAAGHTNGDLKANDHDRNNGGCTTDDGLPCDVNPLGNTSAGDTDGGGTTGGATTGGETTGGETTGGETSGGDTTAGGTTSGETTSGGTTSGDTTGGDTTGGGTTGGMTLQGNTETFTVIGEEKAVDLVLTVDNSGSMAEEQIGLAQRIVDAFSHIQGADYRVALMTTDTKQGIMHFVDSATPGTFQEKMNGLKDAIQSLGIGGSGTEKGFEQSIKGLKADNPVEPGTQSWLRNGSVVAALIVSDEDNCSSGCSSTGNTNWTLNQLTALGRTPGDDARIYGIIRRSASECTKAAHVGNQYMEGIGATNGIAGAICASDYGPTLQQISADIGVIANTTFELVHAPYPGTLQAWINGVQYAGNVELNGKRVTLTDASLRPTDIVLMQYSYIVE